MLVQDRMTVNPVTITPDTPFSEALRIIRDNRFRHLPVVNEKGKLIGVVAERDLLHAAPSSATSLSVFEMNYLLANLRVREMMSSPPITVPEDAPLEEAARVMIENNIGFLPVMRDDELRGVITETDIFRAFVEILGGGVDVKRVTLRMPNVPGELARITRVIADLGGNLCAIASFRGADPEYAHITVRLEGVAEDVLLDALRELGEEVSHVCCTDGY